MKTAEEWLIERLSGNHGEPMTPEEHHKFTIALYKAIQTDAFKAGIKFAIPSEFMSDIIFEEFERQQKNL